MSDQPARYPWGADNEPRYITECSSSPSDEEGVPDCVGKLLGARCFILHHPWTPSKHRRDRLYSLYYEHMWTPGKDERAQCLHHMAPQFGGRSAPRRHASPHEGCKCGLYAYYSYWRVWWEAPRQDLCRIFAVVSGWGSIEEHKSGFRSEYMRIEALVGPSLTTIRRRQARKRIERFAENYAVPVIWSPWDVHSWMDDFAGGVRLKNQK